MGDRLVRGDVWHDGVGGGSALLQAGYEVSHSGQHLMGLFRHRQFCSIQSWALKEAKARMEARGEKPEL